METGIETWVDPQVQFSGRIFTVRSGPIMLDNGEPAYREVVEHPGGVCVLPFDGTTITLVRQYRIAVGEYVIEAPAGKLEPGDNPERRAALELEEEAGLHAGNLIPMGVVFGCVGFCSERIHLFIATDVTTVGQQLEHEERIELIDLSLPEVSKLLESNALTDAKTIVLLQRFLAWLEASA